MSSHERRAEESYAKVQVVSWWQWGSAMAEVGPGHWSPCSLAVPFHSDIPLIKAFPQTCTSLPASFVRVLPIHLKICVHESLAKVEIQRGMTILLAILLLPCHHSLLFSFSPCLCSQELRFSAVWTISHSPRQSLLFPPLPQRQNTSVSWSWVLPAGRQRCTELIVDNTSCLWKYFCVIFEYKECLGSFLGFKLRNGLYKRGINVKKSHYISDNCTESA